MKKIFEKMKKEPGFTLLEMSIVIMIIAALLLLIIPNVGTINEKTEDTTSKAVVSTVETQKELYKMDNPEENLSEEELLNKILGKKWVTEKQVEAYKRSKKGE